MEELGYKRAQFIAAEKNGEGMALKILTRAADTPNGIETPLKNIRTIWNRADIWNKMEVVLFFPLNR